MALEIAAPVALEMDILDDKTELFVKQTKKGCLQELMGCEAKVR